MNNPVKKYRLLKDLILPDGREGQKHFKGDQVTADSITVREEFLSSNPSWFELIPEETKQTEERIKSTTAVCTTVDKKEMFCFCVESKYMTTEKEKRINDCFESILNDDAGEQKNYWKKYADLANSEWKRKTEQKYTQQQLEQAERDAFAAGRDRIGGWWNDRITNYQYNSYEHWKSVRGIPEKYRSQEYKQSKQSLSSNAQGRDWEIVAVVRDEECCFTKRDDGYFHCQNRHSWKEETILSPANMWMNKIHSVKRLSDNEVFTMGDSVYYKLWGVNTRQWVIDNFFIRDDGKMLARSKDNIHCEFVDNDLIKVKR